MEIFQPFSSETGQEVTDVTATLPITSSGGTTPDISTSLATNKLVGRATAGTGVFEAITLGTNLSFTGTTLNAAGFSSPLTTKGDIFGYSTTNDRIPVGTNGLPLIANSGVALGVNYAVLGISGGGTGNSTALTAGSVIFSDGTKLAQDNSNFFYDSTNHRLGVGTVTPAYSLDVIYSNATAGAAGAAIRTKNSNSQGSSEFRAENSVGNSARMFKLGTTFSTYKNLNPNDIGFYNDTNGGNISILNDSPSGIITMVAGSRSSTGDLVVDTTGFVGVGTISPSAKLHVINTTEQFRVGYDTSNYYKTTVSSTGGVTFDAVGSGAGFTFSDQITGSSGYVGSDLTASKLVLTDSGKKLISGTTANQIAAGITSIVTTVSLTAQGADIGSTNFTGANVAGLYRVSYTLQETSADVTAGAVTVTFTYTDAAGAETVNSAAIILTGLGLSSTQGTIFVQLASGSIAYSTSHTGAFGTSQYALFAAVERLL